jgi:penicillin-binding protein 2
VYFYGLADVLGVDRISTFMAPFGFGKQTGIDISGEKTGLLPSRQWKAKAFSRPADQVWFPGETVNFGIGQGFLTVTPLQLAHYVSVIASRGRVWKPRLVSGLRDTLTGQVHRITPVSDGEIRGISPEDWQRVVAGMIGATTHGTAAAIGAHAPYSMAGKTGTAQVFSVGQNEKYNAKEIDERLRDHSWFIAFAPTDAPRIAVAVLEENGGWGASAAAPIARKVLDAYLLGPDGKPKPADSSPGAPPAQPRKRLDPTSPSISQPGQKQADAPTLPAPQARSTGRPGQKQAAVPAPNSGQTHAHVQATRAGERPG